MKRTRIKRKTQGGFILTIEALLLSAIVVIGLIVGMVNVRDAVLAELSDVSEAVGSLNQSYLIQGVSNLANTALTSGSSFVDLRDQANGSPIDTGSGNADDELTFTPPAPELPVP